jgi:hypothetical protein
MRAKTLLRYTMALLSRRGRNKGLATNMKIKSAFEVGTPAAPFLFAESPPQWSAGLGRGLSRPGPAHHIGVCGLRLGQM